MDQPYLSYRWPEGWTYSDEREVTAWEAIYRVALTHTCGEKVTDSLSDRHFADNVAYSLTLGARNHQCPQEVKS